MSNAAKRRMAFFCGEETGVALGRKSNDAAMRHQDQRAEPRGIKIALAAVCLTHCHQLRSPDWPESLACTKMVREVGEDAIAATVHPATGEKRSLAHVGMRVSEGICPSLASAAAVAVEGSAPRCPGCPPSSPPPPPPPPPPSSSPPPGARTREKVLCGLYRQPMSRVRGRRGRMFIWRSRAQTPGH
jgi:hypothetical protein